MRRRRLLAASAATVGLAGCLGDRRGAPTSTPTRTTDPTPTERTPPAPTRIGGSVHGRPYRIGDDLDLIGKSQTTWLHAFLDVRRKYDQRANPREDPDVVALRRVGRETDARLFVSLQWNFVGIFGEQEVVDLPPAGSARERDLIAYALELLSAIDEPVDIVGLGNEPIWESPDSAVKVDDPPIVRFTRKLKDHLVEHYTVGDPRFLVGAFNRLFSGRIMREYRDVYRGLFEMARTDEDVDGVDLHVHYYGIEQAERMLEVARQAVPEATITATEFSPMWRYERHAGQAITSFEGGDGFAERHGIDPGTTVVEYFEAAKYDRRSPEELGDFYEVMPWYNVDFVEDMYGLLAEYDVEVGTFGFLVEDDVKQLDWTEGWAPFPINCLFQPVLIDSEDGAHPHYLEDYRRRA